MAQNSALLRPVYSDLNRQMLNSEPLPLMHFFVVTLRGKGVIFQKLRYVAIAFGVFIVSMQLMSLLEFDSSKLYRIPIACDYFYVTVALISQTLIIDIQKSLKIKKKVCWSLDSAGPKIKKQIFKLGRKRDIMAALAILEIRLHFGCTEATSSIVGTGLFVLFDILVGSIYAIVIGLASYVYVFWWASAISGTHIGGISERTNHEFIKYLNINVTTTLLLISGMSLAIGSFWIVALDEEWFAPLMLFICFTLFLEIVASSAQDYEDEFFNIYNAALQIPWFEFNTKNRQAYLLLVQSSIRKVPYQMFNAQINRAFQLRVFEKLYAVANIVYHFYY